MTYDLTDNLNVFAGFAQGFENPGFGRFFRSPPEEFIGVEETPTELQPVVVDNYEVGIRGNWQSVQAFLSGFYNVSELGSVLELGDDGLLKQVRAPKRFWGIEAGLNWQPDENWQLGTTFSWNDGNSDTGEDGKTVPLGLGEIRPAKITAYVNHQTTPDWQNRHQLVSILGREVEDKFDVSGYTTLDFISTIQLGSGRLQIAIENLFNRQFFPFLEQTGSNFPAFGDRVAARGRNITVNYSIDW